MKNLVATMPVSEPGRRDFLKIGLGGAMLAALPANLAAQTKEKGVDWWDARPGKGGVGKPAAIDCHSHWSPELYSKAVADLGQPIANNYSLNYDIQKRVQWMDEHEVQMHVLTLSGSMPWQWASAEQGAQLARIINDEGIEVHKKYPTRFVLGAELPVRDPQLTLKELNRVAGKPGVRAVHMPDSIERHDYIIDPAFGPVLKRIEELGYPIIFHQMDGVANNYGGDRVSGPPNLASALDAPMDHTVLATKLMMSGVLDRYPNLEIVLPHAGGAFPYLAGRIEHFFSHYPDQKITLARPYREYLRRFYYDYLIYYPEAFRFLVTMVGSDRIVVGTDIFAARDIEYPSEVLDQFHFSAAERDLILKGNATKLLHL
ncbi:MAG TPA: amidohydrolase family protein [Candidatus Acidoferrales bacterium]